MATGRGKLSSIDLLPEEAQPEIAWAMEELRKRDRLQKDILEEFNARLADRGLGPISKSAFNRHSLRLAKIARQIEDTREITKVLTERLEPGSTDDLTIMVAEMIKTLVFEMLEHSDDKNYSPKHAKEMAEAIRAAASAQKVSADRRQSVEREMESKVEEAVEKVAKSQGLTSETAKAIRAGILGIDQS